MLTVGQVQELGSRGEHLSRQLLGRRRGTTKLGWDAPRVATNGRLLGRKLLLLMELTLLLLETWRWRPHVRGRGVVEGKVLEVIHGNSGW